jgi:hypothetical protein
MTYAISFCSWYQFYLSFVRFNTVLASPGDYLDGIRGNVKLQKLHWYPQNITKLALRI